MWDFFFLLVSKYVFAHTGKICLAIISHLTMDFCWVVLLMKYFIILETIGGSRVTGTYPYPLHTLYAWARIFLIEQSRGMRSSEGKGRRGKHWKSCERDHKKIPKPFYCSDWGMGPWFVSRISSRHQHSFTISLFVLSTGTGWLCKKHYCLQTLPFTYPYTTATREETEAAAVSLKARKDYINKIFSVENDLTVL